MILTCPECSSRFVLPDEALGEDGRKVKCSACGHVWFQSPHEAPEVEDEPPAAEDVASDEGEESGDDAATDAGEEEPVIDSDALRHEVEEILEEPDEGGEALDAGLAEPDLDNIEPGKQGREEGESEDELEAMNAEVTKKAYGYAAAAGVFVLTFLFFLILHGGLSQVWRGSQSVYGWFGFETNIPAEQLVFGGVDIEMEEGDKSDTIKISGKIMNLGDDNIYVPPVVALMRDENGAVLASWPVSIEKGKIEGHGSAAFKSEYNGDAKGAVDVQLRFTLEGDMPEAEMHEEEMAHEEKHEKLSHDTSHAAPHGSEHH
jgi:predicted Zn finger-like uncharacterized protein